MTGGVCGAVWAWADARTAHGHKHAIAARNHAVPIVVLKYLSSG